MDTRNSCSDRRDGDLHEGDLGFDRDSHDERGHDDEGHLVEHREAEDRAREHHRDLDVTNSELGEQCFGDLRRGPGVNHQLTDDCAEHHDDGERPQGAAEAALNRLQQTPGRQGWIAGRERIGCSTSHFEEANEQSTEEQREHRVDLPFDVEGQHQTDAERDDDNVEPFHG